MKIPGNHGHTARPAIQALTNASPAEPSRTRMLKHRVAPEASPSASPSPSTTTSSTRAIIRDAIRHASRPDAPSAASTTNVAPPGAPPAAAEPLTVDGLIRAWGDTEQSSYDLNADGKVDAADLAQLLARLSETETKPPETNDSTGSTGDQEPDVKSQIDALMAAWGTNDPSHDLDGDGTVGAADLATLLAQLGPQPPAQPDAASTAQVSEPTLGPELIDPTGETPSTPQTKLDALLAAWGSDNSTFDLNGDGSVGPADLAELLAQSGLSAPPDGSGVAPPEPPPPSIGTTPAIVSNPGVITDAPASLVEADDASLGRPMTRPSFDSLDRPQRERLAQLSNQLFNELRDRGFHQRPPMNIREIVSGLDLSQLEQKFMLSRLAKRYPHGLGLNVVG